MRKLLMNMNKEFDFNRYDDLLDICDYNGFIDDLCNAMEE